MSFIEKNFHTAIEMTENLVKREKDDAYITTKYIYVQVAYNEDTFELFSVALNPSKDGVIPKKKTRDDAYYNMRFIAEGLDDVLPKFRDKYLYNIAFADISTSVHDAYFQALRSETGECTLKTSYYRPTMTDMAWAYKDVFKYSDYGHFRCWFSFDEEFKEVTIQADADLIAEYENVKPRRDMLF